MQPETHLFSSLCLLVWYTQVCMAAFSLIQINCTNRANLNFNQFIWFLSGIACVFVHGPPSCFIIHVDYSVWFSLSCSSDLLSSLELPQPACDTIQTDFRSSENSSCKEWTQVFFRSFSPKKRLTLAFFLCKCTIQHNNSIIMIFCFQNRAVKLQITMLYCKTTKYRSASFFCKYIVEPHYCI